MTDCNSVITPLELGQGISKEMEPKTEKEVEMMSKIPYRGAIGSLLYLTLTTRPDLSYAVNLLSRYCENPGPKHWGAVKRIFRYLNGTMNLKLHYGGTKDTITGYSDSDWAGDLDKRRSTSGFVFTMSGGAISWNSKRQATVTLSSTEAELISAVICIQEAIWLRSLNKEIFDMNDGIKIYLDNKGAIQNLKNNNISSRTKHVDIKLKFIMEKINGNEIEICYLSTTEMPADILTKAVGGAKLIAHLPKMGLNN